MMVRNGDGKLKFDSAQFFNLIITLIGLAAGFWIGIGQIKTEIAVLQVRQDQLEKRVQTDEQVFNELHPRMTAKRQP